jgi:cytochrome P450
MPNTPFTETPVFLRRDGLLPDAALGRTRDVPGLTRSTTVFGQECWLVSRADDVRTVLGDADLFTTGDSVPIFRSDDPDRFDLPGALLFMDPPDHTVLRRMLTPRFTTNAIDSLRPRILDLVDQHLEAMAAHGPGADLVAAYSWPIPSQVICELLGIPLEDRADFQRYIDAGFNFSISEDERAAGNAALNQYVAGRAQRAMREPGDDLLGALVREQGDALTLKTLTAIVATLIQAGHETTADMIASSVLALLAHPEQLALLRKQPELTPGAVEELLRYLAIVQISPPRRATRDTTVGGQRVAKGELLLVSLPAANHDPALTPDPGRLDITRPRQSHLAFGHGIHRCVGAPLARLELEIALPALLNRFPDLRLAVPAEALRYKAGAVVHGVASLPVTW